MTTPTRPARPGAAAPCPSRRVRPAVLLALLLCTPALAFDYPGGYRLARGDCDLQGMPEGPLLRLERAGETGYRVLQPTFDSLGSIRFPDQSGPAQPDAQGRLGFEFHQIDPPAALKAAGRWWVKLLVLEPEGERRLWIRELKMILAADHGTRPTSVVADMVYPEGGAFGADETRKFRGSKGLCLVRIEVAATRAGAD